MKLLGSKTTKTIIFTVILLLSAISITMLSLLNLPFFYEKSHTEKAIAISLISLAFFLLTYFGGNIFILPYKRMFLEWKNLLFVAVMTVILTATFALSTVYYWSIPNIHTIEMCYDADKGDGSVMIESLMDPNRTRIYSPQKFKNSEYPLLVQSGNCINGEIVNLDSLIPRWWIVPRLTIYLAEEPPYGRFSVKVNEVESVVYFDDDYGNIYAGKLEFNEGFDQGTMIKQPWRQRWFFGVQAIWVIIGATFFSFLLWGITERIISYPSINTAR